MNFIKTQKRQRSPEKDKRLNYILGKVSGGENCVSE